MSTHDRGAFGALLAEAKRLGCNGLRFEVDLLAEPDDAEYERWSCGSLDRWRPEVRGPLSRGRTGEEAFRRLVESLRGVV